MLRFFKHVLITCLFLTLFACAAGKTYRGNADLAQGQRYFESGYYRRALHQLLPLACDGNPQAQYAVGYIYYYGYGVAQDTEVGYFWIKRSANQGYIPAQRAARIIAVTPSPQVD